MRRTGSTDGTLTAIAFSRQTYSARQARSRAQEYESVPATQPLRPRGLLLLGQPARSLVPETKTPVIAGAACCSREEHLHNAPQLRPRQCYKGLAGLLPGRFQEKPSGPQFVAASLAAICSWSRSSRDPRPHRRIKKPHKMALRSERKKPRNRRGPSAIRDRLRLGSDTPIQTVLGRKALDLSKPHARAMRWP
jgi:hypothetical protein